MKKSHQLLVLFLILFGACNTIFLTLQNHQQIPELTPNNKFFHPFIQTAVMFLGQALVILPYFVYRMCKKQKNFLEVSGFMKVSCPIYLPVIPAIMDLLASSIAYVSLSLIAGSVWQISRGGVIITTAVFSRLCLGKRLTKASFIGCGLAFVGITLVQIFEIFLGGDKTDIDSHTIGQQIMGAGLLIVSLIFNTMALISQKIIFNKFTIHPLKMVFLQGIYGFIGICLILLTLNFIECPDIGSIRNHCIKVNDGYYIESLTVFIDQISRNMTLLLYVVGLLISIGISVPLAVTISKVINPVSRSLADVCRTVIIWAVCLFLTFNVGKDNQYYRLEKTGLLLNLLKLAGFLLVIFGTMIYHEVIRIFKEKKEDNKESLLLGENDQQVQSAGTDRANKSSITKISFKSQQRNERNSRAGSRESLM